MSEKTDKNQIGVRGKYPIYRENPSVTGRFSVAMRAKSQKDGKQALMIAPDTGEVLAQGTFGFITEEEVDNEQFVKIYLAGIKQHGQLTKAGLTIFEIVYELISGLSGKDRDTVTLNYLVAQMLKPNLSRPTYYRGIDELLERGFLFRSLYNETYFINVRFMFNGDRLVIAKAYRRKGSPKQSALAID